MNEISQFPNAPSNTTCRYEGAPGQMLQTRPLLHILVDIVILMDQTGSMQSCIEGVKRGLQGFVDMLAAASIDLRLGLILFRDEMWGEETECYKIGTSPEEVKAILGAARAEGGKDEEESSLLAIRHALALPGFRADAKKMFFLVSDAPPHPEEDGVTAEVVSEWLRENQVTFFACCKSIEPYKSFANMTQGTLFTLTNNMPPDAFRDIMKQFASRTIHTMKMREGADLAATMRETMRRTMTFRNDPSQGFPQ